MDARPGGLLFYTDVNIDATLIIKTASQLEHKSQIVGINNSGYHRMATGHRAEQSRHLGTSQDAKQFPHLGNIND